MATYIYQGSTPILRFKPLGGISVSDPTLGDPTIAVSQLDVNIIYDGEDITVDANDNSVWVQMTETETLRLVDGTPVQAQLSFANTDTEQVVRFPIIDLTVLPTIADSLLENIEPTPEPGEDEYDDEDAVEDGDLEDLEDYEDYELADWYEYYDDTLEEDLEDLEPIDDVEPWEPSEEEETEGE